jgi:SAM-dependent methyltransferase
MNPIEQAEKHWDKLHGDLRFRPRFPNDNVVRFLFGNFPREGNAARRALDIGVGGGRHTRFMADMGFQVAGIDISSEGLRHTGEWLASVGRTADLRHSSMLELPFDAATFDAVVAFGVINYNDAAGMQKAIAEVHRVLKPGGPALFVTRTDRDYRFGKGDTVEPGTFRLTISETNELGSLQHFLSEAEIPLFFKHFADIRYERTETTFGERTGVDSDWILKVRK